MPRRSWHAITDEKGGGGGLGDTCSWEACWWLLLLWAKKINNCGVLEIQTIMSVDSICCFGLSNQNLPLVNFFPGASRRNKSPKMGETPPFGGIFTRNMQGTLPGGGGGRVRQTPDPTLKKTPWSKKSTLMSPEAKVCCEQTRASI